VAEAIDEMLPDVAQTQTQTGQDAANAQFNNLNMRISNLHAGVSGPSFNGLTLTTPTGTISLGSLANSLMADEEKPKEESAFSRWGFFVSGNIGRGSTDAIANAPEYDFDIKGLTAGVDYRMSDNFVLGGALGYTRQSSSLSGDQGSLKMEGWSVSGYATWYREKDWYFDGVLNLANNDFRHRRRVSYILPGETVDQVARADSDGTDISGSLTIGRDFHRQEWNFGLYGRAQFGRQHFDGYDEDLDAAFAGSGLALRIDDRSVDSLSSILGGRASWVHSTDWGVLMPQFGLEWQKEYQGDPDTFRAFLITDPTGTPILITGEALDDSYFRLNLGLSAVWPHGRSGFIQYDRIFARDGNEQETLTIGGRFEF
jgi:outer membrane autotransporter protein